MASYKGLRQHDHWDQGSRLRYGSKGRLTHTMVLGDPGTPLVFNPITLSPKRRGAGGGRQEALERRTVGGAEIGSFRRSLSAPSTPSTSSSGPRHVSLGHTVRSGEHMCGPDSEHYPKALEWYTEPGAKGAEGIAPIASMSSTAFVDKSPQWEVAKPPKTQLELDVALHKRRAPAGTGPFTANSSQRASYVSHADHRDKVWMHARSPQKPRPRCTGPRKDRRELTSTGTFRGWTAEEMANARGIATFTAEHTTVEQPCGPRPHTFGRNTHYFQD